MAGFPGSVMATWQRSGRVGRSGRESITALVALPDALDQYLLDHPVLAQRADDGFLWRDWVHLTSFGHKVFAEHLVAELARLGVVEIEQKRG